MAPRRLSGPVQRAALSVLRDRHVVSSSEIMAVSHPRQLNSQYRSRSLRRFLDQIATRVGRAPGMGRPVLWQLRPEFERSKEF